MENYNEFEDNVMIIGNQTQCHLMISVKVENVQQRNTYQKYKQIKMETQHQSKLIKQLIYVKYKRTNYHIFNQEVMMIQYKL